MRFAQRQNYLQAGLLIVDVSLWAFDSYGFMKPERLAFHPPWAQWIGLAVEFQAARPSVIPPLWRDDRCAPKSVEQADLEGNHSYKFIYSGFSRTS